MTVHGLHVQINELEEARRSAEQFSTQLQTQLDEATAFAQSQATELASAQAQLAALSSELQDLLAEVAKLEAEQASSKEAWQAQEVRASEAEERCTAQVSFSPAVFASTLHIACPVATLLPIVHQVCTVITSSALPYEADILQASRTVWTTQAPSYLIRHAHRSLLQMRSPVHVFGSCPACLGCIHSCPNTPDFSPQISY